MIFIVTPNYRSHKGMTLLSLLVTLALFSGVFLAISQWGNYQRQRAMQIYQGYQALQIAENQKQRLFLHLPCESEITQNQQRFRINCNGDQVSVSYPLGKIEL